MFGSHALSSIEWRTITTADRKEWFIPLFGIAILVTGVVAFIVGDK
jgi:hypothetical protein